MTSSLTERLRSHAKRLMNDDIHFDDVAFDCKAAATLIETLAERGTRVEVAPLAESAAAKELRDIAQRLEEAWLLSADQSTLLRIATLLESRGGSEDAERYRWLLNNVTWFDPKQHVSPALAPHAKRIFYHATDHELDTLTEAIDAARKDSPK